jgi:hypothetical protein
VLQGLAIILYRLESSLERKLSSYIFTLAQSEIANSTLDLATGNYYAHLVTAVPPLTATTVANLVLATADGYAPKPLTGLIKTATKWTFDSVSWLVLNWVTPPVGTVICKRSGTNPAPTDRVVCYSDRSQSLSAGSYGVLQNFPADGVIKTIDSIVLNLQFEGASNSSNFVDSSIYNRSISSTGDAILSTTNPISGTSSGSFGNTGYITIPASNDFVFGSINNYIKLKFKSTQTSGTIGLIARRPVSIPSFDGDEWIIYLINGQIQVWWAKFSSGILGSGVPLLAGGSNLANGISHSIQWKAVGSGTNLIHTLEIDGVVTSTINSSAIMANNEFPITIGADPNNYSLRKFIGQIDDLVISTS